MPVRVSSLLRRHGLVDASWFTPESRERGRTVHLIAESVLKNSWIGVSAEYEGYDHAVREGLTAAEIVPIAVERRLTLGKVTGRPDLVGYRRVRTGTIPPGPTILDLKSGDGYPSHGVQVGLYERLAEEAGLRALVPEELRDLPWVRLGLYVRSNGTYRLVPYGELSDYAVGSALLQLHEYQDAHGLLVDDVIVDDDPVFA